MRFYSNPSRESDTYALPDCEVFELTAEEAAALDEELMYSYSKKHCYRLAHMNDKVRDAMLAAMVDEEGITGGYYYQFCLPGCLPDSSPFGPYVTAQQAIDACRKEWEEDESCVEANDEEENRWQD